MDPSTAAYLERARETAEALTPFEPTDDAVAAAAADLEMHAGAGLHVPVAATPVRRLGQAGVRRLVDWYLSFLIPPVADLGRAAARFGGAVTGRLEGIEGRQAGARAALEAEAAALRSRVAGVEERLGARPPR